MEDDVSAVVEVVQVVATVEASVAEDVLQQQLLKSKHSSWKAVLSISTWCIGVSEIKRWFLCSTALTFAAELTFPRNREPLEELAALPSQTPGSTLN